MLLELTFYAIPFLGIGGLRLFDRDIGPAFCVVGVELQPALEPRLGVRLDRLGRAFWFAHATINALVRVNDEHVFAFVKAVDGTHLDAIHVLAFDAVFRDDVRHLALQVRSLARVLSHRCARRNRRHLFAPYLDRNQEFTFLNVSRPRTSYRLDILIERPRVRRAAAAR